MELIRIGDLIRQVIVRDDAQSLEKTIMSIAGITHLENIWSNIYAYYLDEHESHGLGSLFLKGLENIIQKKTSKSVSLSGSTIKREYSTIGGNRIDLLIQARGWSIIIENKVHHQLDNDLSDYWISVPGRNDTKIGIVLTLSHIIIKHPHYINVTHLEWISEIEKEMLLSEASLNSKAVILLKDFIENVKQLSMSMEPANTNFYLENRNLINGLYSTVKEYRDWLQSIFSDKAFIRSLGDFTLVHNDWIGCKHRFAMYRVLSGTDGELVITVFYELLWNSRPGNARLCLYLEPLGDWLKKAKDKDNKEAICSIANANGVPSKDIRKDFWHCASVEIPVPESHLQKEEELKEYLKKYIGNPDSGLMTTARKVGKRLSETHLPSYQWKDAADMLYEKVSELEDIKSKFVISQIRFKFYEPTTQIVVLEVTDNLLRFDIERFLDRYLLQAIQYAYGDDARYTILCRQLMF